MKTYSAKAADIKREWHVVDATDQILGKLAIQVAQWLSGKHKPMFTPSMDCGDFVVVINADKVRVTGDKARQKMYYHHSGYPGGLKSINYEKLMQMHPASLIASSIFSVIVLTLVLQCHVNSSLRLLMRSLNSKNHFSP